MASTMTGQTQNTSLKRRESTATREREGDQLIITPLGAGCEVGRSCVHMSYRGKTIMVSKNEKGKKKFFFFFSFWLSFIVIFFVWAVWLRDSSSIFRDGGVALFRRDRSLCNWRSSHYPVSFPFSKLEFALKFWCYFQIVVFIFDAIIIIGN